MTPYPFFFFEQITSGFFPAWGADNDCVGQRLGLFLEQCLFVKPYSFVVNPLGWEF